MKEINKTELAKQIMCKDIECFGKYLFDNHLKLETPDFHREIYRKYQNKDLKKIAIAAPRSHAKAQCLDSNILTTRGWIKLSELEIGDYVFGKDGKKKRVICLHPIEKMDLYRIRTRDGRSTLCNLEHLFPVEIPSNTGDRLVVKSVKYLLDLYKGKRENEFRCFLPTVKPIKFGAKKFKIDPYTLGCWLGDGHSASARFTTIDTEILDYFPYKTEKKSGKYLYQIYGLHTILRESNLLNNKHIPKDYLFGSVDQRTRLLQGLVDTDGSVSTDGMQISFVNKNKKIIDGFIDLVRSLGGSTTLGINKTRFDKNSQYRYSYRVIAKFPKCIKPVRLKRKLDKWKGSFNTKSAIISIEYEKTDLGRCITIEDDYYVTDDFLLTHNSTVTDLIYLAWEIIYKRVNFVLLVSDTYSQAVMFLGALKAEFEGNEKLRGLFGDLTSKNWSEGEIVVNGVMIKALGAGMKVRGLKYREGRPDLIIVDDLENDELVENKDRREKLERWYNGALVPCMGKDGRIIVIGTILHYDSLLYKLVGKEMYLDYDKSTYQAITDNKPLWPEHLDLKELLNIKQQFINNGQVYLFYQEYQNDPVSGENRKFKWEKLKYYTDEDIKYKELSKYITIDRAYSKEKTADSTGIIVNGVDKDNNWFILLAERFKGTERELIDKIFDLKAVFKPIKIGIEQKAFEYTIKPALEDRMRADNNFFLVDELKDLGRAKNVRIEGLLPRYEMGTIYFRKEQSDLIDELIKFPMGIHDDLCDSLSYQLEMAKPVGNNKPITVINNISYRR